MNTEITIEKFDMGDEDRRDEWFAAYYKGERIGLATTRAGAMMEADMELSMRSAKLQAQAMDKLFSAIFKF